MLMPEIPTLERLTPVLSVVRTNTRREHPTIHRFAADDSETIQTINRPIWGECTLKHPRYGVGTSAAFADEGSDRS